VSPNTATRKGTSPLGGSVSGARVECAISIIPVGQPPELEVPTGLDLVAPHPSGGDGAIRIRTTAKRACPRPGAACAQFLRELVSCLRKRFHYYVASSIETVLVAKRAILPRMSSADFVQTKGLGLAL